MAIIQDPCAFRVYLPVDCLDQSGGLAVGFMDGTKRLCCITGLFHQSDAARFESSISDDLSIVGVWEMDSAGTKATFDDAGEQFSDLFPGRSLLRLRRTTTKLSVRWQYGADCSLEITETRFVIVLFDATLFASSLTFPDAHRHGSDVTNAKIITDFLARHRSGVDGLSDREKGQFCDLTRPHPTTLHRLAGSFSVLPNQIGRWITCVSLWISNLRIFRIPLVESLLEIPSVTRQVRFRFSSLDRLSNRSVEQDKMHKFRQRNSEWLVLLDIFLGLCLMIWLLSSYDFVVQCADFIVTWAESVAVEIESLLNWLMGVPAGLKLNEPLAHFLGNFFLYHIFLWKAYLRMLKPFWADICYYSCLTGCFGFTIQISLLRDLLSMMTIHIYCFYVYAARLYSLQVVALSSLFRLFRGKKWNVLRKRVDSASYEMDQLFIGTLLFTILLFLLPTTALFYGVFALLRLVVLSLQGILHKLVSTVNGVPVYWLFLRIYEPYFAVGGFHASVIQSQPLCVALKPKPLTLLELLRISSLRKTTPSDVNNNNNNSWSCLGKKLFLGQLIYPWIEPSSQNT